MAAYLIVRATVPSADRDAFDRWYQDEHLPDARVAFQARSAQRGWSDTEPGVHVALYEFPDLATAKRVESSDEIAALIAEFDRVWQGRVTRVREIFEVTQVLTE